MERDLGIEAAARTDRDAALALLVRAIENCGFFVSGPTDTRAAEHGEPAWVCDARALLARVRVRP